MTGITKMYEWISVSQIVLMVLIVARMSGLFLISPLLSNKAVPNRVKIPIVVILSFLILPSIASAQKITAQNHIQLLVYIFQEVAIGLAIGYVAALIFAVIQTAGDFYSIQAGYSMATIFDPNNEVDTGVITSLYTILGALIFLYLDGHHVMFSALTKSYEILPLAQGFNSRAAGTMSAMMSQLFALSIQIAAPIIVVMTVLNVIMGLLSKISPQLNIYMNIGFIVGPVLGMILVGVSLPLFRTVMTQMTEQMGPDMMRMIRDLKGG